MPPLSPEVLLLAKHLRIKLIDLRDLAVDQMGHDLLDVIDRVVTYVVESERSDVGLLIACERDGGVASISAQAVRFD